MSQFAKCDIFFFDFCTTNICGQGEKILLTIALSLFLTCFFTFETLSFIKTWSIFFHDRKGGTFFSNKYPLFGKTYPLFGTCCKSRGENVGEIGEVEEAGEKTLAFFLADGSK